MKIGIFFILVKAFYIKRGGTSVYLLEIFLMVFALITPSEVVPKTFTLSPILMSDSVILFQAPSSRRVSAEIRALKCLDLFSMVIKFSEITLTVPIAKPRVCEILSLFKFFTLTMRS